AILSMIGISTASNPGSAKPDPTTPYCTSEVTTAVWAGSRRFSRVGAAMTPTVPDDPSGNGQFHRVHPGPTGSPRETSAVTSDGPSDLGAPMAELPKIISVDDHVVEPAHVWQEYLPQ